MSESLPTVSVLIPCYNEREWIQTCLDSLLANDYPSDRIEFVVIDGGSDDGTLDIITDVSREHPNVRVLPNPVRLKPHGLNLGIEHTTSEVLVRADAHARYPENYVRRLVEDLDRYEADNTGGIRDTYIGGSRMARAIGIAISHRFAAGNAHYRTGSKRVRLVDSVFGGCYRREVFERIGNFNEHLIRTQDRELNRRLLAAGGKIVLDPEVRCLYYPRGKASDYWRWNFNGAYWLFYARRFTDVPMVSWRNLAPLSLVAWHVMAVVALGVLPPVGVAALAVVALYWATSLGVSLLAARRHGDLSVAPHLMLAFAMTHFGYGLASFQGWLRAAVSGKVRG